MAAETGRGVKAEDFASYPPLARALAQKNLATLQALPVVLAAILLRELSHYDWQFPAERAQVDEQLEALKQADQEPWKSLLERFAALPVTPDVSATAWAAEPERTVEKLTAYLWTVHAMDAFHAVATEYGAQLNQTRAAQELKQAPARLCIVLLGHDAPAEDLKLFARLRPYGTAFTQVQGTGALQSALHVLHQRAEAHPAPYAHWLLSGTEAEPAPGISTVSWNATTPLRHRLLATMDQARTSGTVGPEDLRSLMARLRPEQVGAAAEGADPRMSHFALSLLTEGSGTQIFSTTFVQWAAREALRRARPQTLVVRYGLRQQDRPMNDLLASEVGEAKMDPRGSLIDADMGAFYTWINLTRLSGAERARFIAVHEGGQQAVAVAPSMATKSESTQRCTLEQILQWTEA